MTTIITFDERGNCTALQTDAVRSLQLDETLGAATVRRASHIFPCHPVKRFGFRVLRLLCGERGRVAEWVRSWAGPWEVRFTSNIHRVVFSHPSRRVCVDWEIDTINKTL
jgi:hypothetical protein